jgi:hypothetical protein
MNRSRFHGITKRVSGEPSKSIPFKYTWEHTEFEIQAFLYASLKNAGYHVRGEVAMFSRRSRFDLVIFDSEKHGATGCRYRPLRIIEVKKRRRSSRRGTKSGNQVHGYYESFGYPVDFVCGMKEARKYLEEIPAACPAPQTPFVREGQPLADIPVISSD